MANVALVRLIGLKVVDKMETSLLSNQDISTSLLQACVRYQSCFLDPIFGSIVTTLGHPLQSVLQVHVACTPTFKRPQNNVRLKKRLSHVTMWFLFLYTSINPYTILYPIASSTSSWPTSQYTSIFCTNLDFALAKHQIFTPY
jgi:hypothetical protein